MLCCVGLFGGLAVGQALGGPWTVIAPVAGFGIGFIADMKLMKRCHQKGDQRDTKLRASAPGNPEPVRGMDVVAGKARRQVEPMGKT